MYCFAGVITTSTTRAAVADSNRECTGAAVVGSGKRKTKKKVKRKTKKKKKKKNKFNRRKRKKMGKTQF